MKKLLFILLVIQLLEACKTTASIDLLLLDSPHKVLLAEDGPEEFFYWEVPYHKELWSLNLAKVEALHAYRDTLKLVLGKQLYESAVEEESAQNLENTLIAKEENGDRINALLVHTGMLGQIRKINHLESQLLNYQLERFPLFSHPTEFHAFIAKNEQLEKIRIYFGASDTEWPPHPTVLIEDLEKAMVEGWRLIYHVHNHYCKEDQNYVGILAPSLADAQYFKMLKERFKVEKALITNGFHTVEIRSEEFEKFESH